MWDERYSTEEYAYGKLPNDFLAENYWSIPEGRVLSLAEGEGRNAVFLAKQGYSVTAVDSSQVGLDKARKLAKESGVEIELIHSDLAEFEVGISQWDGIISIFCHQPSAIRQKLHEKVVEGLKPNGVYLVEHYTPEQMKYATRGGKSEDRMSSRESLIRELVGLNFTYLAELERNLEEGIYHTGLGAVVQAIARKET